MDYIELNNNEIGDKEQIENGDNEMPKKSTSQKKTITKQKSISRKKTPSKNRTTSTTKKSTTKTKSNTKKKRIYNPVTKKYYRIRLRSSKYGKPGQIKGLWGKKKKKMK